MQFELFELKNLLSDAAEIASVKILVELGHLPATLSKREAYRKYGEGVVKRWISEGLIKVRKDGNSTSKCRLNRMELETLSKANNRLTYKSTAERQ
ncbi:hypothetical protein SAMN05444405_102310 [Bacteroides luti]|uniref:Uncharacterized protein n=1 Tax=Bacteroides luti TaxID=1297750 RepID=A0A1M4VKX7_9BACE|nr:hypothetical protein [Bacteroides luti]SHE69530.1 hypothetical protein SAMN05444405_102310 [Bacteroides luti]